jgi:putative ABC transport system permease protein
MIRFLLKGILRDRTRSLFPFLIVVAGVFLTVAFFCYIKGAETDFVRYGANLSYGHVKVMTRAYQKEADQMPNDLALTGLSTLVAELRPTYPDMEWAPRITFGGLLDIPDEKGETKSQGPAAGLGVDLLTPGSREPERLELRKALVRGRLPAAPGEVLLSNEMALKLKVLPGEKATLISTTMAGSMAMKNFTVAGTVRFGIQAMDRTAMIADLADVQAALDMDDAASQILGFFGDGIYRQDLADGAAGRFNTRPQDPNDDFRPVMQTLREEAGMGYLLNTMTSMVAVIIFVYLLAMALVLWNAGLIGTLRRHGEFGLRLAIGEDKGHVYRTMIYESLMIGVLGTVAGTILGLALSYFLQAHGLDFSGMLKNITLMMPTVLRSRVTPMAYLIGFVPGILATFIGSAIAGRRIYRRQTAQLFKELET